MNEGHAYWDEVLGSMPDATLAVRRAAFSSFREGQASRNAARS